MVISHKHRYLFVELPRTACTAITQELIACYDGEKILTKHSTYERFLRKASDAEKGYFVFSGIRNPLDRVVSAYLKLKKDHRQLHTRLKQKKRYSLRNYYLLKQFEFVQQPNVTFADFFQKYYRFPYDDWSSLSHQNLDYIIRFENLQSDFSTVLNSLSISQKRPIPMLNKTEGKEQTFWDFYTPEIIPRAKRIFGPFMEKWDYSFPESWGNYNHTSLDNMKLEAINVIRKPLWRYSY